MNFMKNRKVSQKIFVLIILSSIFLLFVGIYGINGLQQMSKNTNAMYKDRLIPNTWIAKMQLNNTQNDAYVLELFNTKSEEENNNIMDAFKSSIEEIDMYKEKIDKLDLSNEERSAFNAYNEMLPDFRELRLSAMELGMQNKNEEAFRLYNTEVKAKKQEIDEKLNILQKINLDTAEKIAKENKKEAQSAMITFVIIMIIAIAVTVFIGIYISRMITKPLKTLEGLMEKGKNGDFTELSTYNAKDEIGSLAISFNGMSEGIREVVKTINESSQQLAASSEELSASAEENTRASEHISETIQELATGSENQMQQIDSSSKGVNNISDSTTTITQHAEKVVVTAEEASRISAKGAESMIEATKQMNSINLNVINLAKSVSSLESRTNEIGDITKVITDISSQTNLLALNAAIEAARAGEQGKGFAVVAEEVRKLAEQSSQSAEQISSLIAQIQEDTKTTSASMDTATIDVQTGLSIVNEAGESFKYVEHSVRELVLLIEEVFGSLQQLKENTNMINDSVQEVSHMAGDAASKTGNISAATEEQVASMEEISASATILANLATELQSLIQRFKI
ncbi:methyl-accepting chemotaxis protein [Niallia taxi]|uniref:methyl-accepting chemotaxis protein n=1 Tax=Niallia taxi TaxID=2499688 RepID=UPI00203BF030|nr:methyl-accepting chemotaxis protein [Niallia taxi]MCM3213583.1 methyl-accepting chemotaxis protein [Niallia taxi]